MRRRMLLFKAVSRGLSGDDPDTRLPGGRVFQAEGGQCKGPEVARLE